MKKTLILAMTLVCLLSLVVGCGSQNLSNGPQDTAKKDYGEPMDINLSSEEVEVHGVHLRLPDNSQLQQYEQDVNGYQTVSTLDDPITQEIVVYIRFSPLEKLALNGASASGENYTPEAALIVWSDEYADVDTITVKDKTHIAGADARVLTKTSERMSGGVYEETIVSFALNSGIVSISYDDLGGRYSDLIQESIDSIWIDEDEIPEIARITSPEALQAAGLREQPWEIDCESFGVYLNVPEGYTPTVNDDGSYAWVSPDDNTRIDASTIDASILTVDQERLETNMAQRPGFEGFEEFYQGTYHDMYVIKFKHKMEDDEGEVWAYLVAVAPRMAVGMDPSGNITTGEAVAIAVTSRTEDGVELPEVMNTLRYADGWNNGGVLDMEALSASN